MESLLHRKKKTLKSLSSYYRTRLRRPYLGPFSSTSRVSTLSIKEVARPWEAVSAAFAH